VISCVSTPIFEAVTPTAHPNCYSPLFFFYSTRAHRDLHSFPTRRSSDLRVAPGPRPNLPAAVYRHWLAVLSAFRCARRVPRSRVDRKSTRLNSSHSQISYAVFCLKKKKETSRRYSHVGHGS